MVIFADLLCRVYKALGGDCGGLDWADGGTTAVATVRARFDTYGPPVFGTQQEADQFRATLDQFETHLASPDSTISPQLTQEVQGLIDDLRQALGW